MDPGITAALAAGFAALRRLLCRSVRRRTRLSAIAAIVAFALVHIAGVKLGTRLLTTLSV